MVELNCMFHLRRVQFQNFVKEKGGRPLTESINDGLEEAKEASVLGRSTMILLDKQTKIGRNPELVDVVLHSVVHSNMISRDHSEIIGELDKEKDGHFTRYFISDRSLNGTYVNDTRVKDLQQLKEGDLIKFGHVNGAAIKPGEFAPQQSAEFIFRFERALPNYSYFGYNSKGIRIQSEHRRAYMQINSDRVLPTEVYSSSALAGQKVSIGAPGPAGLVNNTNGNGPPGAVNSSGAQIPLSLPSSAITSIATLNANAALPTPTHPNPPTNQLAHLAAVAAATTQNAAAAQQQTTAALQQQPAGTAQHQQTLNALNQLGLGGASEEQVAAMNQLRSLMASHDAMTTMERLAAQQQWQKSLLNLNTLQQQNPLIYGHAFPAAAAAAAALFTGIGGIDLNSAAANPAAAQYAAAASLWPNIRATLQPTAATAQDWSQQQKAAAIAQQLQLRLPGNLYQPQQLPTSNAQVRASAVTVASSLFGAPSAFSLPGSHSQNQANSNPPSSSNVAAAAGLLIAAHTGQQHPSTSSSSSSAAYSSCTSSNSQPPGIRPAPLSRGASSSSLGPNLVPTTTDQALSAAAAQLAAARQLAKEALEVDQAKAAAGWPSIGISCTSASGNANANSAGQKVSPIMAAAAAAASRIPGAFQGTPPVSSAQLQRIPGIASALAAAMAAAQQQQQANGGGGPAAVWQASGGTPPVIPTPTPSATPANLVPLGTPPAQQPLAQRLLSSSNSSLSLSGTSKSSSGVSSLQSPNAISNAGQMLVTGKNNEQNNCNNFRDSLSSSSACTSSLNISGTSSAFSTPAQQNSTNLSTLTAAMFAAEDAAKRQGAEQQQEQMIGQRRASTSGGPMQINSKEKGGAKAISKGESKTVNGPSNGPISIAADLNQLQIENKNAAEESKNGGRQLMECDSSVPSPPSKQDDEMMMPRPSSSMMVKEEEGEGEDFRADLISRKRHSDSGDSSLDKPRPMKQPRKSNEVARLLNDLTAGNCSWQYMAEKQQQRQTSNKTKEMNKQMTNKNGHDRKKPLRLDERKQLEIEKKKGHKMMRQISDSESSVDEHPAAEEDATELVKNSVVADSEDEEKNAKKMTKEKLLKRKTTRHQRSSSSASSDSIPEFSFFLRDQVKKETGKSFSSASGDSELGDERPVTKPMNGDGDANAAKGKRGRKAGSGKKGTTEMKNTVIEDQSFANAAKGKRGRKAGSGKKGTTEMKNTIMEDWTGGKGDPEKCAHSKCKRPKEMSINWVQCDDCDEWYHSICVFGKNRNSILEEDKWFCTGCQPKPQKGNANTNDKASSSTNNEKRK